VKPESCGCLAQEIEKNALSECIHDRIKVRLCGPLEAPNGDAASSHPAPAGIAVSALPSAAAAAEEEEEEEAAAELVSRCVGLVAAGCEGLALHGRRPDERAASSLARWGEASERLDHPPLPLRESAW
jgi:hypothetical protein